MGQTAWNNTGPSRPIWNVGFQLPIHERSTWQERLKWYLTESDLHFRNVASQTHFCLCQGRTSNSWKWRGWNIDDSLRDFCLIILHTKTILICMSMSQKLMDVGQVVKTLVKPPVSHNLDLTCRSSSWFQQTLEVRDDGSSNWVSIINMEISAVSGSWIKPNPVPVIAGILGVS